MGKNDFFKLTPLYKEFIILDYIDKDPNVTQRMISDYLGISVSMVNSYIDGYEKKGYIIREYFSSKIVHYLITKKGIERKKLLNIWYLKSSLSIYYSAKENIINFLNLIINKGFKKILLYGAGEVSEIILKVMNDDNNIPLEVLAVIDDDIKKQHTIIVNKEIICINDINKFKHDGVLISSYTHHETIYQKLIKSNYPSNNIIHFFDN